MGAAVLTLTRTLTLPLTPTLTLTRTLTRWADDATLSALATNGADQVKRMMEA